MSCESVTVEFRSLLPVIYSFTWVAGIMLVGILRIWILNWRWLYFATSIPSTVSILYYWFVLIILHPYLSYFNQFNCNFKLQIKLYVQLSELVIFYDNGIFSSC